MSGVAVFLAVVHRHYPIQNWLFWVYAALWAATLLWATSCVSIGHLVVGRALGLRLPLREHLLMSFATGVLVFGLGIFVLGLAGALSGWSFCFWPTILLTLGGPSLFKHLRVRFVRFLRLKGRVPGRGFSMLDRAVAVFGLVGIAILYLQIMTPANLAYDARWYHLGLAEGYAVTGTIARFDEGWFLGTLPQLATWLYTWAFTAPRANLFFDIELAAHVEMVLFLATLAGIPPLFRWLTGGRGGRGSWAAIFLFPGIFVYDSNLNASADHVLAFWAAPLVLSIRRVFQLPRRSPAMPPRAVLLGIIAAGALSTKYQVMYLLVGSAWLVAVQAAMSLRYGADERPLTLRRQAGAGAIAVLTAGVLSAPHWLKNWIWYRNPVYPFLHGVFGGIPWTPEADVAKFLDAGWRPEGSVLDRIGQTLRSAVTFSFEPHDHLPFHGNTPVFGSLFVLLLPPLLFVRGAARTWCLAVASMLGILIWFWSYHQDRYLQSLLPWMAAVTAAAITLLWRVRARVVRVALVAIVAAQIVWGGDLPALPTHGMAGSSPIMVTFELLSTGYRNQLEQRFDPWTPLPDLAAALPPRAVVLLHEDHLRLGLARKVISDSHGRQGGIGYRDLVSASAVYERLHALGITHVAAAAGPHGSYPLSDDLVFFDFLRGLRMVGDGGGYRAFELRPSFRTSGRSDQKVAVADCEGVFVAASFDELDRRRAPVGPSSCDHPAAVTMNLVSAGENPRFVLLDRRVASLASTLSSDWQWLFSDDNVIAYARTDG